MKVNNITKGINALKKSFLTQYDQSDCGVVCLYNIINFHGGEVKLEKLRELSGTTRTGTTMLGMYQASSLTGFETEGLQAGI